MPAPVGIQTFERRQKQGGLGSVLGFVTGLSALGPLAKPVAKGLVNAASKGDSGFAGAVRSADRSLSGAGHAIDVTQDVAQAAAPIAIGGAGLISKGAASAGKAASAGNAASAGISAASAAAKLTPDQAKENFENLKASLEALKSQPLEVRSKYTKDILGGIFALGSAHPNIVFPGLQQSAPPAMGMPQTPQPLNPPQAGPAGLGGVPLNPNYQGGY